MTKSLTLRLSGGDLDRLRTIAARFGILGKGGYGDGQPNASGLIRAIAAGELTVSRPDGEAKQEAIEKGERL